MPQAVEVAAHTAANGLGLAPVMPYYDMEHMIHEGAACGQCYNLLKIVWGGSYGSNGHILTCGDMAHNTILKIERKTKQQINSEKVFKGYSMKALTEYTPTEMVARADSAGLFPQTMNQKQREAIGQVCVEYGLDPLMNELMIYQGRPYVTVAARLRKAQEAGDFAGISTRAATNDEKESRGYQIFDYVMLAEAYKMIDGVRAGPFQGWGVVKKGTADRADKHLPIGDNPAQHAEKRAISRAVRMAWHIPLPSFEDLGTEDNGAGGAPKVYDVMPAEQGNPPPVEAKGKPKGKAQAPPAPATEAPAPITDGTLLVPPTNYGELKAIAHARQPEIKLAELDAWIAKTVGMDGAGVSADPSAAYTELKTLCGWED